MLVSEIIDRTYSEWLNPAGINRPAFDTLNGAITDSGTSLVLNARIANVPRDTILEIGSELILLKDNASAPTYTTAARGYLETAAAAHSDGDIVYIDPKFPRINLFNALVSIVGGLYPKGLYQRTTDSSITWDTSAVAALPSGTEDILSMVVRAPGSDENYSDNLMEGRDYRVLWEFTPPKLRMIRGGYHNQTIHLVIKKDFTLPTAESDDITTTCGVSATLAPYLPMAVAGFLLQGREIPRVQIEDVRRALAAAGVQVGSAINVGQALLQNFERYVGDERRRMLEKDPTRFAVRRA